MSRDDQREVRDGSSDVSAWLVGRRNELERWIEETSNVAISKVRSMLAEEIKALSRRVEKMHDLLDQLERIVEVPADGDGPATDDE